MCPGEVSVHLLTSHFTPLHIPPLCVAPPGHAEWRPLVKRYSYRERDYAFGQMMLTLRTTIGLTQAGLADRLGVSRRAVAEWEAEEIRALWRAAHQKLLLDEDWLHALLAPPVPVPLFPLAETLVAPAGSEPAAFPRIDWVEALDVSPSAGREVEVAELSQRIVQERCRLVMLLGM